MKKIFLIIAVAAISVTLASCGGKKAEGAKDDDAATKTEQPAATSEKSALDQYEDLINKAIELYPKVKAGDASAVQDYQKLTQDMTTLSTKLSEEMAKMTPEQAQKFAELAQKLAAVQ